MKVAICGFPPLALQVQESLKNSGIEFKFFIEDFVSTRGGEGEDLFTNLPLINFFEFRRLVNAGELDGVIIAENRRSLFTKEVVSLLKLYKIPQVGIMDFMWINPVCTLYWLDPYKIFLPYLEADITDVCNLRCRGCYHFANFSYSEDIYPLENYRRDMSQISKTCDVPVFRLLGGEPLVMKNFDEYMDIARQYFPKSALEFVTNGLLIPSASKKIFDSIRKNKFVVSVSVYPPTEKILDKIEAVLDEKGIPYRFSKPVENFLARMTLSGDHDPLKTRRICSSDVCRSMLNGRIYKCPIDEFSFKLAKKFGIENFPAATSVDIYAQNFSSLIKMLDGDIELCHWCGDKHRQVPWSRSDNPKLEDWLANPDELKNFVGG